MNDLRHPTVVTFDCAQTLVDVRWTVDGFLRDCALAVGLDAPDEACLEYRRMYLERLPEFLQVNLTRDEALGDAFWSQLTADWVAGQGIDPAWIPRLQEAAARLAYGPDSILFRLYGDVVPCLDALQARGMRVAVISNWDFSLHRVLRMLGVYGRFEAVVASLEEGVEKPDPRLFHLTLERLGVAPGEALHVGDHPDDDFAGATGAGMRAVLLDRARAERGEGVIRSLAELPEVLDWTA